MFNIIRSKEKTKKTKTYINIYMHIYTYKYILKFVSKRASHTNTPGVPEGTVADFDCACPQLLVNAAMRVGDGTRN